MQWSLTSDHQESRQLITISPLSKTLAPQACAHSLMAGWSVDTQVVSNLPDLVDSIGDLILSHLSYDFHFESASRFDFESYDDDLIVF